LYCAPRYVPPIPVPLLDPVPSCLNCIFESIFARSSTRTPYLFLVQGEWLSGFFDKGSFTEYLSGWARTVIVGRARLGGIPVRAARVALISSPHCGYRFLNFHASRLLRGLFRKLRSHSISFIGARDIPMYKIGLGGGGGWRGWV
jgi:hypothetical protein